MRNMRYWSGRGVTLLVLDGSRNSIESELISELKPNIQYHHLPVSVHDRLGRSIDMIDSEYIALCGDDEFFSPNGLENCISELEKDEALVSCMGRCVLFDPSGSALVGRPSYLEMKDYALMHDDPIERMVAHMGNYTCSTIYSVIKAPVWKHALSDFSKHKFHVFSLDEYLFEMVVAFMGKSKVIPNLYWFRSMENERIIQNENKFNVWWNRISSKSEKEEFINLVVDSLSMKSGIDKKTLKEGIIKTGDAFSEWCNTQGIGGFTPQPGFSRKLITYIGARLPYRIKMALKRLIVAPKTIDKTTKTIDKTMHPFREAVNKLQQDGVSVNEAEITEIENIVMEFHKRKQEKELINA
jgi:glycosyltransferase domain-containing protein